MSAAPHFRGKVCNGHIELDDSVQIPEGTSVVVTVDGELAKSDHEAAWARLKEKMKAGFSMAGRPLTRDEIYDRRG